MNFSEIDDDSEHSTHTPAQRAAAAARSTWVSVVVNVVLSSVQIVVGIAAKSQGLVADGCGVCTVAIGASRGAKVI